MKKKILILALCVPMVAAKYPSLKSNYAVNLPTIKVESITEDKLIQALINVESSNNDNAYRSGEDAAGCLQIRRTMVRDVNRILRRQKSQIRFDFEDRWDRQKSIEIFKIYCNHYNLTTPEEKARCWNGGPRGLQKLATKRYWEKVKKHLAVKN
jgi:hypothetical protein|tara:strand:+ start:143 stop:604 length:462 start_codon:yes stop_codon:yes gene_type:complete